MDPMVALTFVCSIYSLGTGALHTGHLRGEICSVGRIAESFGDAI